MKDADLYDVSFCAFSNLRRATRVVTQLYDEFLKPTGLRTTQCVLLATINARGKCTVTQLAEMMQMDQTSMTRALNVLKKQGLIKQIPHENDQRKRLVTITPEGAHILAISMPLREQAQAKMIESLGAEETREVIKLLSKMVTAVQES